MREITKKYNIYQFVELSEAGKEKVKNEYLHKYSLSICENLEENFLEVLTERFPNSNLNIQFNVSGGQGDGFNIYGNFYLRDFIGGCWEYWMDGRLPEYIELSENTKGYFYSLKNQEVDEVIDSVLYSIGESLEYWQTLTPEGENEIERYIKSVFQMLKNLENDFYNEAKQALLFISDGDMEETASIHGWEYLEDGSLWEEV